MVNLYEYLHPTQTKNNKKDIKKKDKQLNEGMFTDWKTANTPVFDKDGYKGKLENFCRILSTLVNTEEIDHVNFAYPVKMGNNIATKIIGTWSSKNQVTVDKVPNLVEKIVSAYNKLFDANFASSMPQTKIAIQILEQVNGTTNQLYNYIDSLVERVNRRQLQNYDYIKVRNLLDVSRQSGYELYFDTKDFMDHYNDIKEIFS